MLGFHVLWGLSIDVMVFILYKLYILSPCTAPIPKPNHHRRHSAILHFQKTSLSLIYKLVSSWGPKNVPTRTRILDIAILVGTFCPHNVGFTWTTHTNTHTHIHTHTQRESSQSQSSTPHFFPSRLDRQTDIHTHTHTHTSTLFSSRWAGWGDQSPAAHEIRLMSQQTQGDVSASGDQKSKENHLAGAFISGSLERRSSGCLASTFFVHAVTVSPGMVGESEIVNRTCSHHAKRSCGFTVFQSLFLCTC